MLGGARGLLLGFPPMTQGGGAPDPVATFTVTTTSAQTLTLQSLGVAAGETVTVDWGDGQSNDYTGTAQRTHAYAGAGVWTVTIHTPQHVVALDLRDSKVTTINSADIAGMALTSLRLYLPSATVTFDSADIAGMALTYLNLYLPGATVTFDSADIAGMALTYLYLYMPSATVTFDSADIAGMALTYLRLYLPSATAIVARADWSGVVVRAVPSPTILLGLSQAQVDAVLLGIYDAAPNRTASAGTLNVAGSNAAPSGTLQAACPPTTGREAAYELVNDSCGVIPAGKEYAAVTIK